MRLPSLRTREMKFLSTRTNVMILITTRIMRKDVDKHKNKCNDVANKNNEKRCDNDNWD